MEMNVAEIMAEARRRHGDDLDAERLAEVYESLQAIEARKETGVFYTPKPVARFMTTFALEQAIAGVGEDPRHILRIAALDPACGCGIFLTEATRLLATHYAARLFGHKQPTEAQVFAVMPTVVMWCIFGIDVDPLAVELARIAVSIETGGTLQPEALERHIICGDTLAGASPPAMDERGGR